MYYQRLAKALCTSDAGAPGRAYELRIIDVQHRQTILTSAIHVVKVNRYNHDLRTGKIKISRNLGGGCYSQAWTWSQQSLQRVAKYNIRNSKECPKIRMGF